MQTSDFDRIFENIIMPWFFSKPIFFKLFCIYELRPNPDLSIPFRSGKRIIEYNPSLLEQMELPALRAELLLELERILLLHPFRRPADKKDFDKTLWYEASTMTITQKKVTYYGFEKYQSIEYYYEKLSGLQENEEDNDDGKNTEAERAGFYISDNYDKSLSEDQSQNSTEEPEGHAALADEESGNNEEPCQLWTCEDENDNTESSEFISCFVRENSENFGDTPAFLKELVIIQQKTRIPDFVKLLEYFKGMREKGDRSLTRMRPSRRFGYDQMGSTRRPVPGRILIGVDTSGSISTSTIAKFYSAIGKVFDRYIKYLDVFHFDCQLKTEKPYAYKKKKVFEIQGGGGTSFQPILDFTIKHQNLYDGLIIFTDGYAPEPLIHHKLRTKILWVINSKENYEYVHKALAKSGLVTVLQEV